jgi:hypothetical protein
MKSLLKTGMLKMKGVILCIGLIGVIEVSRIGWDEPKVMSNTLLSLSMLGIATLTPTYGFPPQEI